jgi:hypothetical protein
MRRTPAKNVALGGVFAALAVVIMSMGGLIPFATYVSPVICMLMLRFVMTLCGSRMGWAWYGTVAILSLLLSADKEAAAVFVFLGYYPIVKPKLDARKGKWLWKALLFNAAIGVMYFLLLQILGMGEIAEEYAQMGRIMTAVMLILGNITFFLLDRLLSMKFRNR